MKKSAALLPIALAAIIFAPVAGAREPTQLRKCQTISQPGSYELADNLTTNDDCLVITADFVTIDLAGFTITGPVNSLALPGKMGILAAPSSGELAGIAVRNGSISGFSVGVDLRSAERSIVEGLRVSRGFVGGIFASGIVKGNTVFGTLLGIGISATGIVAGNYVSDNREGGIDAIGTVTGNIASGHSQRQGITVGPGSTVISNTATDNEMVGIFAECPSNVTDNTAINNPRNLILYGEGCNNTNNVAP
jgi:hypothetical protein